MKPGSNLHAVLLWRSPASYTTPQTAVLSWILQTSSMWTSWILQRTPTNVIEEIEE